MQKPKNLIISDNSGTSYSVKDIDAMKESIENDDNLDWITFLYYAYRDTLFMYQFEGTIKKLEKLRYVEGRNDLDIDDLSNSVNYWRTLLTRNGGNGMVTKANGEVEQMWLNIEKENAKNSGGE